MSHRRIRRGAAEEILAELDGTGKVTPAMWAKSSTHRPTRIQICDEILELVGQQLKVWIDESREREVNE